MKTFKHLKQELQEASWKNWTVKTKKKILIKGKDPVKKGTTVTVKAQNPNRAIDMVGKKWGLEKAAMMLGAKEVEVFVTKESVDLDEASWNNWTVKTKKKILIKGKDPVKKGTAVTVKAQNPNRAIDKVGKKWGLEKAAMALGAKEVEVFVAKESVNEASGDKEAYQKYFKGILKKFGVSSPSELKGADKKKFYDEVDAGWESDDPNDKNESVKS